jgi:hypothetical protein
MPIFALFASKCPLTGLELTLVPTAKLCLETHGGLFSHGLVEDIPDVLLKLISRARELHGLQF